jgi:hypothetical protein
VVLGFPGGSAPTDAGVYSVTATIDSPNYFGSTSGTFEIRKALATVTLSALDQPYDGTPRQAIASTTPAGLTIELSYGGSPVAPVFPGDYPITAIVNERNYQGAAAATLRVTTTAVVREPAQILGGIEGSIQQLAARETTLAGNAWISGHLLVPGTPAILLQGTPIFGTTLQGPGATAPSDYTITLAGSAALRAVVLGIDSFTPTLPPAPPTPAGTVDLLVTSPRPQVADFSVVRDIHLVGNVGDVAVPPGTYGKISAVGRADLVIGVAGATTPSLYQVQSIELAGESRLVLAGPVLLRVDHKVEFQGAVGAPAQPELLRIELHRGEAILEGRSVVGGHILAPAAKVILRAGAELHGRVIAHELEIHPDAALIDPRLQP